MNIKLKIGYFIIVIILLLIGIIAIIKSSGNNIENNIEDNNIESITIPGISGVDIYGNLRNKGFICDDMRIGIDNNVFWNCKKETTEYSYIVEVIGNQPSEILTIQATVLNYSNKNINNIAKDVLGYIASVPYNESNPINARDWVKQNIGSNIDTIINKVRFTIFGTDRARILIIAHENSNLD